MVGPSAADVIGRVTLVTGPEEFFAERAVTGVIAAVRSADPEADVSDALATQLGPESLGELAAPSLFSSTRCVVVRRIEDLSDEAVSGILDYAGAPADDVALVLVHSGGQKGSGMLTKLRKLAAVTEVKTAPLKGREFTGFVAAELRNHKVRIDEDAADQLVRAVGQDTRALAAAASQLASDFNGQAITLTMVRQYFGGRAEAKSFAIADAAVAGQTARALEELRWALNTGTAPVLVTSALAGSLRGLVRFRAAPRGLREADLAREVGVPPWKLRDLRNQARSWNDRGLAAAIRVVAHADADIKGQGGDPAYALERMVLGVTWSRSQNG
jgi:DNA polymerase-3 subunit delta